MGPYLCIASNGVPPSVSKRIMLIIHCFCCCFIGMNQALEAYKVKIIVDLKLHCELLAGVDVIKIVQCVQSQHIISLNDSKNFIHIAKPI
ncbi:hypothetical protein HUJ04_011235 [Dendroctonus ponderosae]|nr:hypothetical protein HUJ04_011235 [Dendroctonus ponderosae]